MHPRRRCGADAVRFRAIYHEIPAAMETDVFVESQVCPGDWVHHFYDISDYQAVREDPSPAHRSHA